MILPHIPSCTHVFHSYMAQEQLLNLLLALFFPPSVRQEIKAISESLLLIMMLLLCGTFFKFSLRSIAGS